MGLGQMVIIKMVWEMVNLNVPKRDARSVIEIGHEMKPMPQEVPMVMLAVIAMAMAMAMAMEQQLIQEIPIT